MKALKRTWLKVVLFFLTGSLVMSARGQVVVSQNPTNNLNATVGAATTFSASAISSATPVLEYQWRRNGVNLPDGYFQSGNGSMFLLTNVQGTSGGMYNVVVSDGATAVNGAPASLSANITFITNVVSVAYDLNLVESILNDLVSGLIRTSSASSVKKAGEPVILPGHPGGHPVYFQWTPLLSGVATFSSLGSDFETMMGAYTGANLGSMTAVASCVNDADSAGYHNSRITFNAVALQTYTIVVDGYNGEKGNVVLSFSENVTLSGSSLPTLSLLPPAQMVASNGASATLSTRANEGAVQWVFNGVPTTNTSSTLSVPQADDSTVGTYVAEVTHSGYTTATPATDLQICVLGDGTVPTNSLAFKKFADAQSGAFFPPVPLRLSLRRQSGGGDTRGYSVSQTFSTVGNQSEPNEPSICGQIGGAPEWYVFVAPTNGTLEVDTTGSSFNTMLGVFVGGNSLTTLTNIGCGYTTNRVLNGQPQVMVANVVAGQTNYIVVDGYNGTSGTVHLHVNLGAPVAVTAAPQNVTIPPGSNATFSVNVAGGSAPLLYVWTQNGVVIPGATNNTLTVSNAQPGQMGTYCVIVTNLVGATNAEASLTLAQAPAITNMPPSQSIGSNTLVTLAPAVTGFPAPQAFWYFDGATNGVQTPTLSIPSFQPAAQGTYQLVASNAYGCVTSAPISLFLNWPPRVGGINLANGACQVQLIGAAGSNYVLQVSSNLTSWTPIFTNTSLTGLLNYSDTNMCGSPQRFYRFVGP